MEITIQQVAGPEDVAGMLGVWKQVFEREMGIKVTRDGNGTEDLLNLVARLRQSGEAIGTLTLVDTTSEHRLHESLGLEFGQQARVARFTRLAVRKRYRGLNIPLAMMLEAHRSVIVPRQFDYTWLLFDIEKAASSFLSRHLGFTLGDVINVSEYGRRCPLMRDESTVEAERAIRQAESYMRQFGAFRAPARVSDAYGGLGAQP